MNIDEKYREDSNEINKEVVELIESVTLPAETDQWFQSINIPTIHFGFEESPFYYAAQKPWSSRRLLQRNNRIEGEIATGTPAGIRIVIPRIPLITTEDHRSHFLWC